MSLEPGRTFISRWGPLGIPHLWIIITSQFGTPPAVAVVSISTERKHSDITTIIDVGDHPFIRHRSIVAYTHARIVVAAEIAEMIRSSQGEFREPVSADLLKRIQEGFVRSPFTVQAIREKCKDFLA